MQEPINYIVIPGLEHYPHVTYTWVIMLMFVGLAMVLRKNLTHSPTGLHNVIEGFVVGLIEFSDSVMGKEGRQFFPLIGSLAMFILVGNLIGLVPGCVSPTSNVNTNAGMAVMVFALYQYAGFKTHGTAYVKHFLGPVWWMAPMMFPIEVISHIARPVTLTLRLFGNIKGEDLVILVLGFLVPLFLPMPMIAFAVFTSVLQTVVFILLTMVYIAGALEEAH